MHKKSSLHDTDSAVPLLSVENFHKHHLPKLVIGWQEWCALPKLHIPAIKCKIDTGAKTSALHADLIEPFTRHGERYVHFLVHPLQQHKRVEVKCTGKIIDERVIMNSGGKKEHRYVIRTPIVLGHLTWEIEISLTNRDPMAFRMLLGRDALRSLFVIDPHKILCQGRRDLAELKKLYKKNHPHF
ncbi:MAG: hypothetical protein RLZ35_120 [Pseudomonadota bacterium]|jgi:ribosomal protein S6--L-glutamate ligase